MRGRSSLATALAILLTLSSSACGGSGTPAANSTMPAPPMWGALTAGPFWAGYHLAPESDPARALPDGRPRPMQISVWYPAAPASGRPPMRYREFVGLTAGDRLARAPTDAESSAAVSEWRAQLVEQAGLSRAAADRWIDAETASRRDAPAADGTFPIVLFAAGNGNSPYRETVLCSWLASHGYVVLTMPSQSRITGFPQTEADVPGKAEEQAADLAFMAARAADVSPARVDAARQAVIGYSFGGRGLLVDALRRGEARALVSLDSGLANVQGQAVMQALPYFEPARITAPLLHVYQPGDDVVTPSFAIVDAMTASDRTLVRVTGLRHGDFTDSATVQRLGDGFGPIVPADRHPEPGFVATLEWVRAFLDAHLRGEPAAFEALVSPGATGPVDLVERK